MKNLFALFVVLSAALACRDDYKYHGVAVSPITVAPPLELSRVDGSPFSLAAEKGKTVLVFFGYTHCPDICPATLSDWKRVRGALGADAAKVSFVFVTIDPARDSPRVVHDYVSRFDKAFVGLSGDSATLGRIAKSFGVSAFIDGSSDSEMYAMSHPSRIYLIDREGSLRFMYTAMTPPSELAADLRQLL